ncbi:pectinesterase 1-like [Malania oleifera]|uniref:pectinesterase 1-like n=1 Tax=Malania oleifera TaxID=397392 RepID=UPI0025AE19E6|nr:pectinesterase 1-like [Malania oleifera]
MDSINFFKGYGKIDHLENQSATSAGGRKRLVTTLAASFTAILTLILASLFVALIHESNSESDETPSLALNPADSIKAVCSVTRFPDSCFSTISAAKTAPRADPEVFLAISLKIAIDELAKVASLSKTLASRVNDPPTESALRDCRDLFADSLSRLNDSASAMGVALGEPMLTEKKIKDAETWISAAITSQGTCVDGLEEMKSTVLDEVRAAVRRSTEYASNSLAILANIQTLLRKFDLTLH